MLLRTFRLTLLCTATVCFTCTAFGQDMSVHGIALGSDYQVARGAYSQGYVRTDAVFSGSDKDAMSGFIATHLEGTDSEPVEKDEYLVQAINGKVAKLESVLSYYYSYKMPNTQDTIDSIKQKYGVGPSEETPPNMGQDEHSFSWAYDLSGNIKPISGGNAILCVGSRGDMLSSTRHFVVVPNGGNPFGLGMSVEYDTANECSRSAYASVRADENNPQLLNRIHVVLIDQSGYQALFAERRGQKQKQQDIEGQRAKSNKPQL